MATIKRRPGTGRWQVRYRDPAGRSRSRTYVRKVDAQRFLETNEADKIRGDWIDPQAGRVTFGEYAQRWQATRMDRSPWTRRQDASVLRSLILPTFSERAVSSIRESEGLTWLATLGSADSTRAKAIQKFSAVMTMVVADGAIKSNPADGVKRPSQAAQRVGIALADDDVMAVIAAAEIDDERNAAMVVVLARLGLRVGEAMALRRSDIDFARGRLRVERSLNRLGETVPLKGRRRAADGRWVPLPVDVQDRLRAHLGAEAVAPIEGWLFTNGRGRPISYSTIDAVSGSGSPSGPVCRIWLCTISVIRSCRGRSWTGGRCLTCKVTWVTWTRRWHSGSMPTCGLMSCRLHRRCAPPRGSPGEVACTARVPWLLGLGGFRCSFGVSRNWTHP